MADPVTFAEEAAAEAEKAKVEAQTPTFEGENKFQHAISIWRSMEGLQPFATGDAMRKQGTNESIVTRSRPHFHGVEARQHRIRDCGTSARFHSAAQRPSAKDQGLQEVG